MSVVSMPTSFLWTLLAAICLQLSSISAAPLPPADSKLLLVVETFRHGSRNRISNNSFVDDTKREDYGELTAEGERMHYLLGQALRARYANTAIRFPDQYDHKFMWVKSTNVNRTIISAQSQLAGMFPLQFGHTLQGIDRQFWIPPFANLSISQANLNEQFTLPQGQQFIAVHTKDPKDDQQLRGGSLGTCANQNIWLDENLKSAEYQRVQDQFFQPVIYKLVNIREIALFPDGTPSAITENASLYDVYQLVDTLTCIKWKGNTTENNRIAQFIDGFDLDFAAMDLPENKQRLWVQMNLLFALDMQLSLYKTKEQKRITPTPYFKELLNYFKNALDSQTFSSPSPSSSSSSPSTSSLFSPSKPFYKWIMLSAHDTTIAMIAQAMNFTSWQCIEQYHMGTLPAGQQCIFTYPGFASNVIFELYAETNTNKPFIKVLYNGTEMALCESATTKYCYLDEFQARVENFFVEDYDKACGNKDQETDNFSNGYVMLLVVLISVLGTLLAVFAIRRIMLGQKPKKRDYADFDANTNEDKQLPA